MFELNYQKIKNQNLFSSFEKNLGLENVQNYIPIYNRFFTLNETNYNVINLNNKNYICDIKKSSASPSSKDDENMNTNPNNFNITVKNTENKNSLNKNIFIKLAPLIDPYKYLVGKYDITDENLFILPNLYSIKNTPSVSSESNKMNDVNNSAYIDSFFYYLTSKLLTEHKFIHGIDFYGSFLGIKNNFTINIADDLDYISTSDFFNTNKNKLFEVDDYSHLINDDDDDENKNVKRKNPILISETNENFELCIDYITFDEEQQSTNQTSQQIINIEDVTENIIINNTTTDTDNVSSSNNNSSSLHSTSSSCSSRTSYTRDSESDEYMSESDNENDKNEDEDNENEDDEEDNYEDIISEDDDDEEEIINVVIKKFPVQVICIEKCEDTLDNLINDDDINSDDEWIAIMMQIIMTLLTYQKLFSFTHNDLHTNNIMYCETDKKYIYYCYKKIYYKVPTFGRIFKIIDFGRSIYKFNRQLFCSNSFQLGGDAYSQYNTEPYLNDKLKRIEPNYSFDLCRLGCSIFDYIIEDGDFMDIDNNNNNNNKRTKEKDKKDINKFPKIIKLILDWCKDDKGINILYKKNGKERYPDFKLYKMIARNVHKHTPELQLEERDEFKHFIIKTLPKGMKENVVLNIDTLIMKSMDMV